MPNILERHPYRFVSQKINDPLKFIVPLLERFIATDP